MKIAARSRLSKLNPLSQFSLPNTNILAKTCREMESIQQKQFQPL